MNSRWDNKPKLIDGKPAGFRFVDSDFDILSLFSFSRIPFTYRALPRCYFESILKRPSVRLRLRDICEVPHDFLFKPPQPKNNFRQLIYSLNTKGIAFLREHGHTYYGAARIDGITAHQLLCDITSASFEIAAQTHPFTLTRTALHLEHTRPDVKFELNGRSILIEVDMSSESYTGKGNTIEKKFEPYLAAIHDGTLANAMILFVTINPVRATSMIECLKQTVDRLNYPRKYANQFGFTTVEFDRYMNTIIPPSPWAFTADYLRAGRTPPFNFLQP